MTARRLTSRKVVLTAAFLALAAGGTAACDVSTDDDPDFSSGNSYDSGYYSGGVSDSDSDSDSDEADDSSYSDSDEADESDDTATSDQVFYCADEDGEIVDEDYCADGNDGSSYFLWHSSAYPRGLTPGTVLDGGDYFPADDRKSRRSYKLPASGKVGNGTVKTNVVGRSSGGSGHNGGSGHSGGGFSSGG